MSKSKTTPRHLVGLGAVVGLLAAAQLIAGPPAVGVVLSGLALGIGLLAFKPDAPTPAVG